MSALMQYNLIDIVPRLLIIVMHQSLLTWLTSSLQTVTQVLPVGRSIL